MSKKKKLIGTAVLTAALIAAGVGAGSRLLARYVSNNREKAEMTSSQFHFTSDYLEEPETGILGLTTEVPTYNITDWGDGFDILLYNYEKENLAQIAADDIEYTVSITNGWKCIPEDSDGNLKDTENSAMWTGTFEKPKSSETTEEQKRKSQKIHIVSNGNVDADTNLTVTVETTSPYKKTLSATFHVATNQYPDYTLTDQNDGSVLLTIKSNDYSGTIHVIWKKDNLDPDRTNNLMSEWKETDTADESGQQNKELTLEAHKTYELLFFKQGTTGPSLASSSGLTAKLQ